MVKALKTIFLIAILLGIVFVVFSPCLKGSFLYWDDQTHLVNNIDVRSFNWEGIKNIFSHEVQKTHIPFAVLSYALEFHFAGMNPFVYHLDNLLLHLFNVLLVFVLARQFGLSFLASCCSALIFGIHLTSVEPVAWVASRKDVLYAFFYLLALIAYVRFLTKEDRRYYWLSILAAVLSILSKPMGLSLPLVLFIFDWYWRRRASWMMVLEKIPYFVLIIPIAWLTYRYHARLPVPSLGEGILTWIWCFVFYVRKFVWPFPCVPIYQMPAAFSNAEFFASVLVFLLLIGLVIYLRRNRMLVFAAAFYVVSIFYLLRFDRVADLQVVADRFLYLSKLGFCFLAGIGLERLFHFMKTRDRIFSITVYGLCAMLFMVFGWSAHAQCKLWSDEERLWEYTMRLFPSSVVYQKRGDHYYFQQRYDKAMMMYAEALRLDPTNYEGMLNMATIFSINQKQQEAINILNEIIQMVPDYAPAYMNRGLVFMDMKNLDLALADANEAIRLDVKFANAYMNRGTIYLRMNQKEKAINEYDQAIRLNPFLASAYYNRGLAWARLGNTKAAQQDFRKAIQLNPSDDQARRYLMLAEETEIWEQGRVEGVFQKTE
ncbi:MAG TPA: tetratricopeptide repeat protein [Candidatus Bathyarchaeia archaeon]|nr:tetratricopeptide repeat protein [Candidatus Bathyarchaeia archaeon]